MSLADANSIGRRITARRPAFASVKQALKRQKRDIDRAHSRWSALLPGVLRRESPAGALQAGVVPLRLLQAVLDHADVIALDVREPGHTGNVHMLVTLPTWLLERATAIAAYDTDDEDTDGGEDQQDLEPLVGESDLEDDELAREGCDSDLEGCTADEEPSLGSLDGQIDQEHWADGDQLDRERGGAYGGDCEDDEDTDGTEVDQDLEPDHDNEPDERDFPVSEEDARARSLGELVTVPDPIHEDAVKAWRRSTWGQRAAQMAGAASASAVPDQPEVSEQPAPPAADRARKVAASSEPELVCVPTGVQRPDGGVEMRHQTGKTLVGFILNRDGKPR